MITGARRRAVVVALLGLVAAVASPLGSIPTRAAGTYNVPATIDSTGTTDVTQKLVDFFASVPDGSTIAFPAGGKYRIEGTLPISNRHNLVFDGNGAEFIARTDGSGVPPWNGKTTNWPRNRVHWLVDG